MLISKSSLQKRINIKVKEWRNDIKQREFGVKKGKAPKIGAMATYIAKDIINMVVDENLKQKITSVYYNKLQNKLAYFGAEQHTVIALCEELNIFDKTKGHVFLTKDIIAKENNILSLYSAYLTNKANWIEHTLAPKGKTVFVIPRDKPIPYTLKKQMEADDELDIWLTNKQNMPIDLPTNLFDDKIKELLSAKLTAQNIPVTDNLQFAKLLELYLADDKQPFYNYKRSYRIFETNIEFNLTDNSSFKNLFAKHSNEIIIQENNRRKKLPKKDGKSIPLITKADVIKKGNELITENEKVIRFVQSKDRIMRLMSEALLKEDKSLQISEGLLLKNIYPTSEHNPLDKPVIFEQTVYGKKLIAKDSIENNNQVTQWIALSEEEKLNNPAAKKWYRWTVKDFGSFKKLIHDRRLPDLLKYFIETEIPISIIEHELKHYDLYREKFFENIFGLEKAIITKDKEGLIDIALDNTKGKPKKYKDVQFDKYQAWLIEKQIACNAEFILEVRNKMSHSQFPEQTITQIEKVNSTQQTEFDMHYETKDFQSHYPSIMKQIYEKYNQEIANLIVRIEAL